MNDKDKLNVNLDKSKDDMDKWYVEKFMPFKKQKENDKKDFEDFAKIVSNNPKEIKYMLASIYNNDCKKAVNVWNELNLKPKIKEMKLENNNLEVLDEYNNILKVNFDKLLLDISTALGHL